MSNIITEELKALFQDSDTLKVIATIGKDGVPHVVFKDSIQVDEEGNLFLLELMETSQTNRNMVYSIWFDKKVSVTILTKDKTSYQIKGSVYKDVVSGPLFEEQYKAVRTQNPKADLAGVWIIHPEELRNETLAERLQYEIDHYPIIGHLDRDLKR